MIHVYISEGLKTSYTIVIWCSTIKLDLTAPVLKVRRHKSGLDADDLGNTNTKKELTTGACI